tara:strand:- start:772 stop:1188 length:417 start_codon:yes stop_codon:yes gene_type:complete
MTPKYALITGVSSGIGKAIAVELSQLNINVIGIARRHTDLNKKQQNINTIEADLTKNESFDTIPEKINKIESIDYVIHCAGQAGEFGALLDINPTEISHSVELDVIAPIKLLQTIKQKLSNARILFIGSYSATQARHN